MNKRIFLLGIFSAVIFPLMAGQDNVSFGLRGGAYLTNTTIKDPGWISTFDLGYTHYWQTKSGAEVGILTGAYIGYQRCVYSKSYNDQFSNVDYLGYQMDYTVSAQEVKEVQQHIAIEIPMQLAVCAKGWVVHVGPKVMLPIWNHYIQTFDQLQVECYYPVTDVTVHTELITGKIDNALYKKTGNDYAPIVSLAVGADVGYEWQLKGFNRIGCGVFCDFVPYTRYRETPSASNKVITIDPIEDIDNPPAKVSLYPLSGTMPSKYAFSVGLRVYYSMGFEKK